MNPHLLTLALTTPLEQLLELPNAVRIAACAREDLQRFSAEQLAQMLASMDAAITDTVTLAQIKYGGELIDRYEKRDLEVHRGRHSSRMAAPEVSTCNGSGLPPALGAVQVGRGD